ncbi:hypothetical protein [Polyangium sp. 15x6]|uniref:hypothetical protein n=1 Tax=Polyangium sp. 15x6 TaxID=3042687 RepID=UPI00249C74AC|nr:hypothetical protein [Polyangium sp. 15x6]MDI3288332.1 hypothetical protein [Polyangium sp. 15x6]
MRLLSMPIALYDRRSKTIASVRWVDTEHHLVALGVTRAIIRSFLERKFRPVVVVDTFRRGKLKAFVEELTTEPGASHRIVSLYAEDDTLLARVDCRPSNEFREPKVSLLLNAEIRKNR